MCVCVCACVRARLTVQCTGTGHYALFKFLHVSVARVATASSRHATSAPFHSVTVPAATEKQPHLVLCCSFDLKSVDWLCNTSCYSARHCITQNPIPQITHQASPSGSFALRASDRGKPRSVRSSCSEIPGPESTELQL